VIEGPGFNEEKKVETIIKAPVNGGIDKVTVADVSY
jgi:hypothetical protein